MSPQLLSPEVRESARNIRRLAIRGGMSSLQFQALYHASHGHIGIDCLRRVSRELGYDVDWGQATSGGGQPV